MQFHDLGPLWLEAAGLPQSLHGKRTETVLSALLVSLGEVVRSDWLIDAVWGQEAPPKASAALDTLMWRLRRTLDPGRPARTPSTVLRTEDQGYRLTVPVDSVDSQQFATTAGVVARMDDSADAAKILELTAAALGLWRGRPFDGVDGSGWLEQTRKELAEHRLTMQRCRISALLATGQPEQAVSELLPVIGEHPFVESLWAQRMLGLYRSGRATAALDAFRDARTILDTELGISPGPELHQLQQRILRHDSSLLLPVRPPDHPEVSSPTLSVRRSSLVGRDDEIERVAHLLRTATLVTITGPVGCGKTRLAIAVAERIRDRFPDGAFFVDLSDLTDPDMVAGQVFEVLGLGTEPTGSALRTITGFVAGRHLLLVLDNCEQVSGGVAELVESVLDTGTSTRIVSTSRQRLDVEGERTFQLHPLRLPAGDSAAELAASPAVRLFYQRLADDTSPEQLDDMERAAVARICVATDGLPLSLELAAGRARVFQFHEVADAIDANPIALGSTDRARGRPRSEVTLRDSIDSSHRLLTEVERTAHRRLSVLPPGFTIDAAIAACRLTLTAESATTAVTGLVNHSLLEASASERPHGPTTFRQLVAIRAHAAEQLSATEQQAAVRSVREWVVDAIARGPRLGRAGQAQWYQRLDDNYRTIAAILESAITDGPDDDILVTVGLLVSYWLDRMRNADGVRLATAAHAAAGTGNSAYAEAAAAAAYGSMLAANQEIHQVHPFFRRAVVDLSVVARADRPVAAYLLLNLALCCWVGDDYELATEAATAAAEMGQQLGDPDVILIARALRSSTQLWSDPVAARANALAVIEDNDATENNLAALLASLTLSIAALIDGDGEAGLIHSTEIIRRQQRLGVRSIADTLETRGNHYVNAGHAVDAVRCYGAAHQQNARVGRSWPRHRGTDKKLATARELLSDSEFAQAWGSGERLGAANLILEWL